MFCFETFMSFLLPKSLYLLLRLCTSLPQPTLSFFRVRVTLRQTEGSAHEKVEYRDVFVKTAMGCGGSRVHPKCWQNQELGRLPFYLKPCKCLRLQQYRGVMGKATFHVPVELNE